MVLFLVRRFIPGSAPDIVPVAPVVFSTVLQRYTRSAAAAKPESPDFHV
jgi:hypothetical protein